MRPSPDLNRFGAAFCAWAKWEGGRLRSKAPSWCTCNPERSVPASARACKGEGLQARGPASAKACKRQGLQARGPAIARACKCLQALNSWAEMIKPDGSTAGLGC
eukprot:366442-Chlamydomonas_euryale.AAC.6